MSPDRDLSRGDPVERRVDSTTDSRKHPRRLRSPGRRSIDHDPRTTFTKKFLVIAIAVVNAVYLASEAFLAAIHAC